MPFFGKPNIPGLEQKRDIEGLIRIQNQKDPDLREQAAEALGRIGEDAISPMINALRKAPSAGIMEVSYLALALGRVGEPAIEPLIATLRENNLSLRINATVALGYIGVPAVTPLINLFSDPDGDVRGLATAALGRIGQPAVEPLIPVLADSKDEVRLSAAVALGLIPDKKAIDPLRRALHDNNRWVRLFSAGALAKIDKSDIQAVGILREATQDYGPDSNENYRGTAASFLKQITPA